MRTIHLIITGNVQGVFYRASAKKEADRLGIVGWIRNNPDGSVECVAQGEKEKLAEFEEWCWKGPEGAAVINVEHRDVPYEEELHAFCII